MGWKINSERLRETRESMEEIGGGVGGIEMVGVVRERERERERENERGRRCIKFQSFLSFRSHQLNLDMCLMLLCSQSLLMRMRMETEARRERLKDREDDEKTGRKEKIDRRTFEKREDREKSERLERTIKILKG